MPVRHRILVLVLLIAGVVLLSPVGDWLHGRSDALWWQVVPWVLLALFWAGIGAATLRGRHRARVWRS